MPLRYPPANPAAADYSLHLGQLFRTMRDSASSQVIVGSDGRRLDYSQLQQRIHRLAHVLRRLGIGEGDMVAVMDWDSHRFLECYFAVPMMGAVLQMVNVRMTAEHIARTLIDTRARVLLLHQDFEALVAGRLAELPHLQHLVRLRDGPVLATGLNLAGEYEDLLADSEPSYPFRELDERALATTFHTTGTTGLPKAVAFSHRQLVLHTLAVMAALANQPPQQGLRRGDVYMPITPMFHVHAWGIPYIASILGLKQVYPGRYDPQRLVQLRRDEGVTFSHCVPTILQMIVTAMTEQDLDAPTWTVMIGGSALPAELCRRARQWGITALAGYGMSESAPVLTIARATDETGAERDNALCSAGYPIPLIQLRTVDPAMQTVAEDGRSLGEVVARGPWMTAGYGDDAEQSRQLWHGGWLHTQDIGCTTAAGYLEIRDRLKDVIKTGGEWISSSAMEAMTMTHPQIVAAAYVAIPDDLWGERPVAFLVPGPDSVVDEPAVRRHLQSYVEHGAIARYAVPEKMIFLDRLPLTSVGKVDKKALRAGLAEGRWA